MKNIFFIIIFSLSFVNASNNWEKLFASKNVVFFIDKNSIKGKNEEKTINILINYNKPSELGDYSMIVKKKLNCKELIYQDLVKNFYKKKFGEGLISRGSGKVQNPKWQYSAPGSASGEIIRMVCNL